ncbi:MAG: PAS domain-containing protein [Anaerolineae bacterium]
MLDDSRDYPHPPTKPSFVRRTVLAALLFGSLAAASMVVYFVSTIAVMEGHATMWSRQRGESLISAMQQIGRSLAVTARDYGVWDETWAFVSNHDADWAATNLDWLVEHQGIAGVAVLDREANLVYGAGVFTDQMLPRHQSAIAYVAEQLRAQPATEVMLFEPSSRSLYWLAGTQICRSEDAKCAGVSNGVIILAKLVGAPAIAELETITGVSDVTVVEPSATTPAPAGSQRYFVPLTTYLGPPGLLLAYDPRMPLIGAQLTSWRYSTVLGIGTSLFAILGLLWTTRIVAMRPFQRLTAAVSALAAGETWQPPEVGYREFQTLVNAFSGAVSRQKAAEEGERHRADELRSLLDSLPAYIFFKDRDGHYVTVSQRMAELFGLTPADMAGKAVSDLLAPEVAERLNRSDIEALSSGRTVLSEEVLAIRGRTYIMHITRVPVSDEAGEVTGLVGMAVDVTEQHRLTEALRQSQKLEAVGQLAGGVAHDFNNVLTVVMSGVHLALAQVPPDGQLARDMQDVAEATARASQITRQLLFLSRSNSGEKAAVDANDVVSSLGKMLHRLLGEDVAVELDLSPQSPVVVADRTRLEQVLLNLALNARDAMPHGGRLSIRTAIVAREQIAAALADPQNTLAPVSDDGEALRVPGHCRYLLLAVTDTGIGVAPDCREHVFTLFFTTKEGRGTGLGLSVVQTVVHEHQGRLWFWSEPGTGSTFCVALPITTQAATAEGTGAEPAPLPAGSETVMIVEDDDAVRLLTERVLTRQGYQVVVAATAAAALDLLGRMHQKPALLLSDVIMPGMSGFELAQLLRERYPSMRVLLTSGYPGDSIAARGLEGETASILRKPYSPSILSQAIREALDGDPPDSDST